MMEYFTCVCPENWMMTTHLPAPLPPSGRVAGQVWKRGEDASHSAPGFQTLTNSQGQSQAVKTSELDNRLMLKPKTY